ncbi:MAG TPA: AAA family ATPase [Syntrophales bacterium]|nr:AAA family ATPase [Syntrophales bacterium]HOM07434.1 AAA family ATPase [Syntrophales bacterium]HON99923.1 AAA family ATPase [Syntrophales bacterium]HPC01423.1 AAA family ATPase [Syntrophales bacterium]HPQ06945.1 AAA family ATPase [Syntrophales bacterium]
MYLEYWSLTRYPFENVPDPDFMYYSPEHEEALARLMYAVDRMKGAALLTGEVGSGKTTLSRVFIRHLPEERFDVGLITNPSLTVVDFLREVAYQLGLETESVSKAELLAMINKRLLQNVKEDKNTLLIVDEAQLITRETFEEIRLLLNFQLNDRFLMTFFLLGQPELNDTIRAYPQLDQRIAIRYHLNPLSREETVKYILFRLGKCGVTRTIFTEEALKEIYEYSGGIPRKINNVCDLALLVGFSLRAEVVDGPIVAKVVRDSL